MQKWYDRLAPIVERARDRLREIALPRLVQRSGCAQTTDGDLRVTFLWQEYRIRPPRYTIVRADTDTEPSDFVQAILLTYLVTADGATPSDRWVSYRDLPGGMFYAHAFHGYAEVRLARELGAGGIAAFRRAAEQLGGRSIEIGNAGYAFQLLPRVHLAAVYWEGDEDLAAQASILFEDTAPHYMSTDGLAVLGSHLVDALVRATDERDAA